MLSIGQFSKACMVTVKTLRHYDKLGLIRPAHTDEWTGYRYYDESQIPRMLAIARFKRYGFSLGEISGLLSETDKGVLFSKLSMQKLRIEQKMAELISIREEVSRHMKNFERTGDIMDYRNGYEIALEQAEPLAVLSSRQVMSVDEFGKYYGAIFERAAKERIKMTFTPIAVYHDKEFDPEGSDIEVAVCVENPAQADRVIAGGLCAVTTHYGGYSNLSDAYGTMVEWINENGYEIAGPPYELYIKNQYDKLPPEEWETKIFFPVKK
ncbi:MAG: MerR family transcriptional regulator [Oscillospiraceae bacterium]|nr:MerR family transcriptional regulator [Oscillospiraceae bacterium]